MKIGMIIAIERELNSFLESGVGIRQETVGPWTVYHTTMHTHPILAVRSGAGEIDAAAATQLLITWGGCQLILNFGVAGALVPGLRTQDLFLVRRACHYDYDVSAIDPLKRHQYQEYPDEFIPLDDRLIALARTALPSLRETTVASGDRFVDQRQDKEALAALGCQICDMEIAAIARVCTLNHVPCLSVKCISDPFEGDGGDFVQNVKTSARKAFAALDQVIAKL